MRFCVREASRLEKCKTHRWICMRDRGSWVRSVYGVIVAMRFRVARNTSYVYDLD
jgi:hypothetical protein